MKRMVYMVIAVAGLVVAGVIFAGCTVAPLNENSSRLTGISITRNHMNFGDCYSFYLREEDNRVLFDAEVRFDEEPYCIILESCEIDRKYFDELIKLDDEYSIINYVTTYRKKPSPFVADDQTVNKITVYLSNSTDKSADAKDEHVEVLYEFFFNLAKNYINESVCI